MEMSYLYKLNELCSEKCRCVLNIILLGLKFTAISYFDVRIEPRCRVFKAKKPRIFVQIRTERNAITAIVVTWVVILLASVPVYLSHGEVTYTYSSAEHTACVFLEADPINRPDGYHKLLFQVRHNILF